MKDVKGTRTEKNLWEAFAGESQARNKYTYYAGVAKREGYEQLAAIFLETADNESAHAKIHLKALDGIHGTRDNLLAAAAGEGEEWTSMYPRMAREARAEGFEEIALTFEGIGRIEKAHQERYKALLQQLESGTLFRRPQSVIWKCRNCGHLHEGPEAPELCPVCKHPRAHFEVTGPLL